MTTAAASGAAEAVRMLQAAREHLAGVHQERLGVLVPAHRAWGIVPVGEKVRPGGHVWHVGVLLLSADAAYGTGEIVRAREWARRGFTAENQRRRSDLAALARRGGYAEGEIVHLGWTYVDPEALARGEASGPLQIVDGIPSVRWSRTAPLIPLGPYLDEEVELLRHPPAGATGPA